jgi:hypothetical protein
MIVLHNTHRLRALSSSFSATTILHQLGGHQMALVFSVTNSPV